ncbi:hypothetical protein B296_00005447 [Ensete ventricosum]|uniref:Uncharacterized protein n=1 Tax=Ensete ventricosum TaxID=4639 RepID=A0A427A8D6_ENSVE|nr:hypothetical protein B296_00005447 [Ensete ventricosum]
MNPSSWANAKTDDSYLMAGGLAICVTKTFGWYMEMDRFQKCAVESLKKLPGLDDHNGVEGAMAEEITLDMLLVVIGSKDRTKRGNEGSNLFLI